MYFNIIREVLEQAIEAYAADNQQNRAEVLAEIRRHIDRTRNQHWKADPRVDPNIEYSNPLCRLGYLYRHVGVNATFLEKILSDDVQLQATVVNAISRLRKKDKAYRRGGWSVK